MILTLTINPALDLSTTTARIVPDKKLRCDQAKLDAGGGGINISKAIAELGGDSLCVFPCGGNNGERLKELLTAKDIRYKTITAGSETRENFNVTEAGTNSQFRFVLPGSPLTEKEQGDIFRLIGDIEPFPDYVVASGSLPPGVSQTLYKELVTMCKQKGARCVIDTSGTPLREAAKACPYLLKPNMSELCALTGVSHIGPAGIIAAGKELINRQYCEIAVISMGASGAVLISATEQVWVTAPTVKKLSTVGAGDSMVGGMLWMLQKGLPMKETLRMGVACGTAAIMNPGTTLFRKEDALQLYEWMKGHENNPTKTETATRTRTPL